MRTKERIIKGMHVSEETVLNTIWESSERTPDFFFIQVGGYDGKTDDPLHDLIVRGNWKGIIIEPDKDAFRLLCANYAAQKNCALLNVAVAGSKGKREFYRISDPHNELPYWTKQLGSFYKDVILKHKEWAPRIGIYIVEEKVQTFTIENLLSDQKRRHVNFLALDTEGADFEILQSFDFNKDKPELILFEHKHLSPGDKEKAFKILQKQGYKLMHLPTDSLAYLPE